MISRLHGCVMISKRMINDRSSRKAIAFHILVGNDHVRALHVLVSTRLLFANHADVASKSFKLKEIDVWLFWPRLGGLMHFRDSASSEMHFSQCSHFTLDGTVPTIA